MSNINDVKYEDLITNDIQSWVIRGRTYPYKEELKAWGCYWNGKDWLIEESENSLVWKAIFNLCNNKGLVLEKYREEEYYENKCP